MRISAEPLDPGYALFESRATPQRIKVLLDGVEQARVITADERMGFIVRAKVDDEGQLCTEGDHIALETVHGRVKVILD